MARRPAPVFKRDIRIPAETRLAFLIGAAIVGFIAWMAAWVLPVNAWVGGPLQTQLIALLPLVFEWVTGCLMMAVAVWLLIRFVIFDGKPKKVGHRYPTKMFWVGLCVGIVVTGGRIAQKTAQDVTPQLTQAGTKLRRTMAEDLRQYDADASTTFDGSELRPENLVRDPDLSRMRRNLAEARQLLAQRQAAEHGHRAQLLDAVRRTRLSPEREAVLLDRYGRYSAQWEQQVDRYWGLRVKILDHAEVLIRMLAAKHGAWRVQGQRLVFSDRALMRGYIAEGEQMTVLDHGARYLAQVMAANAER